MGHAVNISKKKVAVSLDVKGTGLWIWPRTYI